MSPGHSTAGRPLPVASATTHHSFNEDLVPFQVSASGVVDEVTDYFNSNHGFWQVNELVSFPEDDFALGPSDATV